MSLILSGLCGKNDGIRYLSEIGFTRSWGENPLPANALEDPVRRIPGQYGWNFLCETAAKGTINTIHEP